MLTIIDFGWMTLMTVFSFSIALVIWGRNGL